jgi:alkaline phosphatase D
MKSIFIALLLLAPLFLSAQIKSGPMLGYADTKEVLIWVQTNQASLEHIKYREKGDKIIHKTDPIRSEKAIKSTELK